MSQAQRNLPAPAIEVVNGTLAYLGALSGRQKSLLVAAGIFLIVLLLPGTITLRLLSLFIAAGLTLQAIKENPLPPLPLKAPVILWTALAVLSLLWAVDPGYTLGEIQAEILYPLLAFLVFFGATRGRAELRLWLYCLLAVAAAMSVAAIVLGRAGDNASPVRYVYAGVGSYTTFVVAVFPFAVLVLLRMVPRRLPYAPLWLLLPLLLVAAYLTYNRAFWIALAGSSLALLTLLAMRARASRKRILLVASIVSIVALSSVAFYEVLMYRAGMPAHFASVLEQITTSDGRLQLWQFAVRQISEHPWTGTGFGQRSFGYAHPEMLPVQPDLWHPHNMLLSHGVQMGVPGIIAFGLLILAVLREFWRLYTDADSELRELGAVGVALVVGVLIKNMTDSFLYREHALLFWSLVGMTLGYARHKQRRMPNRAPAPGDAGGAPDAGAALKFLVIRRDNIGDLVCTTPLVHALRGRYPRGRICFLVNSYNRPVVENNPDIDAVYDYTKAKHRDRGESLLGVYWRRMRLMHALRRERFDYAIIAGAHFLPRALGLARAVRPRHIVGFTEPGRRGVGHIDVGVPYTLPHPMHEVEDVFRLLRPFGIEGPPPPMRVHPAAAAAAEAALAARGLARTHVIGVHVSARKTSNRWPAERFVALIRALHRRYGASFMLFWSPGSASNPRHPGDDEKAQAILAGLQGLPVLPFATEQLDRLMAGLACCHQVICSDGGALHIAAALGKPIVCFFGKSDATRWYPWGVPHQLLQPESNEVGDIEPAQAEAAFVKLLARSEAVAPSPVRA